MKQIESRKLAENDRCGIQVSAAQSTSFVLLMNRVLAVKKVTIKNLTEEVLSDLKLVMKSESGLMRMYEEPVEKLGPGRSVVIIPDKISYDHNYLASLECEKEEVIMAAVMKEDECFGSVSFCLHVLAFDQWTGSRSGVRNLASFVTPGHRTVLRIREEAAAVLKARGMWEPGYRDMVYGDAKIPAGICRAVYKVIQGRGIPAEDREFDFENPGLRIRSSASLVSEELSGGLDMAVLAASVLESMGIHPIIAVRDQKIFAGGWLIDECTEECSTTDPTALTKRMDLKQILLFDCAGLCAGTRAVMEDACREAMLVLRKKTETVDSFFAVDICRCRKSGIRSLPERYREGNGWRIAEILQLEGDSAEEDVLPLSESLKEGPEIQSEPRYRTFMQNLLDDNTSSRFNDMKMSGSVIPLLTGDIQAFLKGVFERGAGSYDLLPAPEEWEEAPFDGSSRFSMENTHLTGRYENLIRMEQKAGRMHCILEENRLLKVSADIASEEKSYIEEKGVNPTCIVAGLLRWYDVNQKNIARYAPLVLIPVEIYRVSGKKTRKIGIRQDEEPRFNETIAWTLRRELGIDLGELETLPCRNGIIDYGEIRRIVLTKIKNARNWDILDGVFLSNFNFANFTIWKEMKQYRDLFMKAPAVRSLVLGINELEQPSLDRVDPSQIRLPMILDSSQTEAVRRAACGWSMVMNGPPGTGKSQTITAILLWAITHGKRVLFVAEKKAALDIVKNRMKQMGFGDFCLLLQPEKAFRGKFLEQMKTLLDLAQTGAREDGGTYEAVLARFLETEEEVGHYARALHTRLACGKSLWELICLYETLDAPVTIPLPADVLAENSMDDQTRALQIMIDAGRKAGGCISDHPLRKIRASSRPVQLTRRLRTWIPDCLTRGKRAAEELKALEKEDFCPGDMSLRDFVRIKEAAESIRDIPYEILAGYSSAAVSDRVAEYIQLKEDAGRKKEHIVHHYGPDLLETDLAEIASTYRKGCTSYWGFMDLVKVSRELSRICGRKITDAAEVLDLVQEYERAVRNRDDCREKLTEAELHLAEEECGRHRLEEVSEVVESFFRLTDRIPELKEIITDRQTFAAALAGVERTARAVEAYEESWVRMADLLDPDMETNPADSWREVLLERETFLGGLEKNLPDLQNWIDYRHAQQACRDLLLGDMVDYYEEEGDDSNLIAVWKKSVCEKLIWDAVDGDETLRVFSGNTFDSLIRIFREIDADMMKETARKMYTELVCSLPSNEDSPRISEQLTILRKAIQVKGTGLSIRETLLKIPDILLRLCPCMMMSPAAVSQYLPPEKNFDIVLFDEASQVETCKAIPSLARADQFIVVGDHQQMPPSRNFRTAAETEDKDNMELPSILDDIEVLGVPVCELLWHYRSRHESLIAFSNRMFYGSRLMTFPSVNDRERRVIYKWVGGRFESGGRRINREEAAAVAAEIRRRYEDPALREMSVGVVTFNAPQQALVREMIGDMADRDSDFDAWLNDRKEPLFIKNLENVQGDERDVIMFSTAFSPGENGMVSLQFGPLSSSDNGYKRLNVAITRTRCELLVFSSMKPEQLHVTETSKPGVRALRHFLAYARDGILPVEGIYGEREERPQKQVSESMALKICAMLEETGFSYDTAVGRSSMRVDIGVVDPFRKDRYMLGILLDTAAYGAISNVRDREIGRDDVLRSLGWEICHVRAMDWWDDSEGLLKKIRAKLLAMKEELDPGLYALPGPGHFLEDHQKSGTGTEE